MNFIGILIALIFLLYNIYCYKFKKVIYTINSKDIFINSDKFYMIQLVINLFNISFLIMISYLSYLNKFDIQLYVIYFIGLFWIFNFLIKYIAIKFKYISYKK